MPGSVGDQHKSNGPAAENPFEEVKHRPSPYTASEIATLQARLDKQLGPEFISSRPGAAGGKVHYLAGEKVINLANEVFGFHGWSSSIQNIQIDFVDEHAQTGKISLGLSVIVRVTLKDGTYHEDIGYGHIENCKGKAAAFAKAKKEGTTDALKRALRTFGKVLGNCVYDKDFLGRVTRMKVGKPSWDENELHRHPDFVPVKKEESNPQTASTSLTVPQTSSKTEPDAEVDESFDFEDAEFGEEDLLDPDHFLLPDPGLSKQKQAELPEQQVKPSNHSHMATPLRPPNARVMNGSGDQTTGDGESNSLQSNQNLNQRSNTPGTNQLVPISRPQDSSSVRLPNNSDEDDEFMLSSPGFPSDHFAPQHCQAPLPGHGQAQLQRNPPVSFYNARIAEHLDSENNLLGEPGAMPSNFNVHAETPTIRKTAGINHNTSGPLRRDTLAREHGIVTAPARALPGGATRDFIHPRSEAGRRVGHPIHGPSGTGVGGNMSPMTRSPAPLAGMQTSAYRPPTRRGGDLGPGSGVSEANGTSGWKRMTVAEARLAAKRPPLGDVSNIHQQQQNSTSTGAVGGPEANEAKKIRVMEPERGAGGFDGPNENTGDKECEKKEVVSGSCLGGKENAGISTTAIGAAQGAVPS